MFGKLFGKSEPGAKSAPKPANPAAKAMKQAIAEQRKTDPLIGAKIGGKEIVQQLIDGLKDEQGAHIESILTAAGALAGYACQASVRAEFMQIKGQPEAKVFIIANAADGRKYYFGDLLNKPLAEDQYSVWSLAAGAAQQLGVKNVIDVNEIFAHVAKTVGGAGFGIPRAPEGHKPHDTPANYVKFIWPALFPVVKQYCDKPAEWPVLFGFAIQELLDMGKEVIEANLALTLVMESAIPMSKVDFAAL